MSLTAAEYAAAVKRAVTECEQEIAAAKSEYKDAVRPVAAARKLRSQAARAKRNQRIADLKEQLHGQPA